MSRRKRTGPSWKRSPHTSPEGNLQPSLDGSTAWVDLSVLREAIEDLPWAYDSTVEEVLRLRTENRSLRGALEAAKAKLIEFAHQFYGRKSEKKRPDPVPTVETVATETEEPTALPAMERIPDDFLLPEEPRPESRRRGQQPGTAGHGRRRYPQLPANHQYFEASDAAQRCPRCGTYARKCGIDTSTQWEFVVEIRPQVAHRQRYRWASECGGQDAVENDRNALAEGADLTPSAADPSEASDPREASEANTAAAIPRGFTAPGPLSVIPRGLFTHQWLIPVLAWKYLWGVPLHRLRQAWKTQGADIAAGSLVGALQPLVPIFELWYEALKQVNQAEPWWHADETHGKVIAETAGKVGYRWWLWVFSGPQSTGYWLSPSRSAKVPIDYLPGDGPTDGM